MSPSRSASSRIASVDTYLRYAEGAERLQLYNRSQSERIPDFIEHQSKRGAAKELAEKGASAAGKIFGSHGRAQGDEEQGDEGEGVTGRLAKGVKNVVGRLVHTVTGDDDDEGQEQKPHDVREVLERHYDRITETLAGLTGKKEWGVKVLLRESGTPRYEVPSGRWYLERKQYAARKEAENRQQADQRARECHEQLATAAEKSMLLPASNRAGERAVLNAAYLIGDAGERKFHALIAAMDERLEPDRLTLEVTGPWPPYNFVNLDLSLPTAP